MLRKLSVNSCLVQNMTQYCSIKISNLLLILILLLSALQPLSRVLAYSTVVEYSQQEGFYRVPLPAACQTPNLEDQ